MHGDLRDADVVVVGAGLGGLTAAAYLAALGQRVVVVDRHSVAGGNATVFTHHGYEFDVGVHYLGDCEPGGLIPSVLAPLGLEVRFREMDPDGFDTFVLPDGDTFRVPRGVDRYRERLVERFPGEREGIDTYLGVIETLDAELTGSRRWELLLEHTTTTLGSFFDQLRLSPRLRTILCGEHGTYALPPSRASLILHSALIMHYLKRGAYYPEGGGQVIADRLRSFIEDHGGEVVLRTPVDRIVVEQGAVRGVHLRPPSPERAAGVPDEIRAPVVISNADLKRTVLDLVGPEHLPAEYVDRVRAYSMALPLFVDYLVLDRDLAAEGHPNTNVFVVGHDDVEAEYAGLEAGRMPAEPWTYLTFTSLKDPTNERLCRPGQTNMQVMTIAPAQHGFWGLHGGPAEGERYRRNTEYRARKAELRNRVLAMAERGLPGIRDAIVYEEQATPITHERFTRSTGGTSYGIECTPEQFLLNRPAPATAIPGLFLAGASTMGAHGIAAVMAGGIMTASAVAGAPVQRLVAERLAAPA
ncbi:MAG: NAD(P)/FAD-dependent oxidoreductase [Acidimicrobiales bacterium]|nr:NAD(P)/FAD-dependent oxidoreductase [Acidimicrobiales bacterium]